MNCPISKENKKLKKLVEKRYAQGFKDGCHFREMIKNGEVSFYCNNCGEKMTLEKRLKK